MTNKKQNNIVHSIFFKISLLILGIGIIIILFLGTLGSLLLFHMTPSDVHKSFEHYTQGIIDELDENTSIPRIVEISQLYGLLILYSEPQGEYATDKPVFYLYKILKNHKAPEIGKHGFFMYRLREKGNRKYLIASNLFNRDRKGSIFLVVIMIFLISLLLLVHRIMGRILRPIKYLVEGVNRVGRGDLSYRIPSPGKDELGKLGNSFNDMTVTINQMLQSREQLLLDVSHELRSPLTRMKLQLEMISDSETRRGLQEDLYRMEKMIEEILEGGRLDTEVPTLQFKNLSLKTLIQDLVLQLAPKVGAIKLEGDNTEIRGSEGKLRILFRNLIENALKFANKEAVRLIIRKENKSLVVEVHNKGDVIPENDLPHLFEPFYKADKARSTEGDGYGLGLYICKKIVELHGGEIKISSSQDEGTIVKVFFY